MFNILGTTEPFEINLYVDSTGMYVGSLTIDMYDFLYALISELIYVKVVYSLDYPLCHIARVCTLKTRTKSRLHQLRQEIFKQGKV